MHNNKIYPESYFEIALQYQKEEAWDLAIENYEKYIRYNKSSEESYCNIGFVCGEK